MDRDGILRRLDEIPEELTPNVGRNKQVSLLFEAKELLRALGGSTPASGDFGDWSLESLKERFHSTPNSFFDPGILDLLTEEDIDFLQDLYALGTHDRYSLWLGVFRNINEALNLSVPEARGDAVEKWGIILATKSVGDWDRAAADFDDAYLRVPLSYLLYERRSDDLSVDFDEVYIKAALRHLLYGKLAKMTKDLRTPVVFLMAAYAKLEELDKRSKMEGRETSKAEREAMKKVGDKLAKSMKPLLRTLEEDLLRNQDQGGGIQDEHPSEWYQKRISAKHGEQGKQDEYLTDDLDGDVVPVPPATVGSEVGLWMRTKRLGVSLVGLLSDEPGLHEYLKEKHLGLYKELRAKDRMLTIADVIRILEAKIGCQTAEELVTRKKVSRLFSKGMPSDHSPNKKKIESIPTDCSHLAFEGVRLLADASSIAPGTIPQDVCYLWGLPVTTEKHQNWKRSARGKRAL